MASVRNEHGVIVASGLSVSAARSKAKKLSRSGAKYFVTDLGVGTPARGSSYCRKCHGPHVYKHGKK